MAYCLFCWSFLVLAVVLGKFVGFLSKWFGGLKEQPIRPLGKTVTTAGSLSTCPVTQLGSLPNRQWPNRKWNPKHVKMTVFQTKKQRFSRNQNLKPNKNDLFLPAKTPLVACFTVFSPRKTPFAHLPSHEVLGSAEAHAVAIRGDQSH